MAEEGLNPPQRIVSAGADKGAEHTMLTVAVNYLLLLLGVGSSILAARLLGPEGRGQVAAVMNLAGILSVISLLGFPDALTYFSGRNKERARQWMFTAVCISFLAAALILCAGHQLVRLMLYAQDPALKDMAFLYLLTIFPYIVAGLPFHSLQGLLELRLWNVMRLIGPLLWLVTLFVAWGQSAAKQIDYRTVLLYYGAALYVYPLIVALFAWPKIPGRFCFSGRTALELLKYGIPCLLGGIPRLLNLRLDQIALAALFQPSLVGMYAVAVSWGAMVTPLASGIGQVVFPRLALSSSQPRAVEEAGFALRALVFATLVLVMLVGFLALLLFVPVFGAEFKAALPVVLLLVPAAGISGLAGVANDILKAFGEPKQAMYAELLGLLATFVLLSLLLQPYQLYGAALASLLSYSVSLIYALNMIRKKSMSWSKMLLLSRADLKLLSAAVVDCFKKRRKTVS